LTKTVIQKTLAGLIAVGVLFVLLLASMGFLAYRLTDLDHWTIHTHEVIEELKDTLSALQDVETANRGFLIAKDRKFLKPYEEGAREAFRHIDNVARLTADNPVQQKQIPLLRTLAKQKIDFAKATIDEPDPSKSFALVASGRGMDIMNQFRAVLRQMTKEEFSLLEVRARDLAGAQQALWVAVGLLTVSGFGILSWVFTITRTAIEDERQRVAILNEMNSKLTDEVEQRKRTEKSLKDTTIKLTSSNADLQRFAYVASHDLQEPLRAVAGFVTLIKNKHQGQLDDESEAWINHAVEGSQRMRSLINDLLSYARVESRGKALSEVDVNKAFGQAKKDLSVAISESNVDLSSGELPHVMGDESQLTQVFQNLIGNAIKFKSYEKPMVRVDAIKQNGEWLFSVKDNGIGFEQEHADRVFIIFQRLHGREEYKGTGIGLALCKKIVERHGGRIWAQSSPGEGSSFFFTIPVLEIAKGENNGGDETDTNSNG